MSAPKKPNHDLVENVEHLAARFLEVFPKLEPDSRRVAVQLYRLLAEGEAVPPEKLAGATVLPAERIRKILAGWVGVFYEGDSIVGFRGLTLRPFSKHLLKFDGRTEYAWCAWDSLFIPEIIRKTVEVESTDPESGEIVRLTVSPDTVHSVAPETTVMSILEPTEEMTDNIVAKFCHFVNFFPSPEVGEKWTAKNPGTLLISLKDAFDLAKRRNRGRFGEALDSPAD